MPAIRDWVFTYHSTTTTTQISVPLPQYQPGDLLLCVLSADTGSQTWSRTGWTQLLSRTYGGTTNQVNLGVMYKIAQEGETDPAVFTYTVAETANATLLAISDVDTSEPIADSTWADINASRGALPTRTASRANSLVIYASAHPGTATAIPSIIEGPVIELWSQDGAAHSDCVAWTFQATSGTTPNNVYWTCSGTTYSSVLATIVVNPPPTGATQIPTYCAGDASIYVDPIHGTTAFRGNTAFAATATTYWTSPLAGRTLANATVTNRTDFGINTFRSGGGMTGPTAANTYTGATLVLAAGNVVNVTGKNVLAHTLPYLPADIQTVYDTGLGKGIEFGMATSANNAKVWHVHGAFSPFGITRAPVVVNPDNTAAVIDSRGTFNPGSVQIFGFFTCGFLVSSDWVWSMIWISDVTIVAGGNASKPVNIDGIYNAVAIGHERLSALKQGANQLLLLQPVQFGNGGTNPIYLDLNATAIEFPEISNNATRQTFYASVPNYSGITYYAGSNDTIKHRNSVISSASKYHWRFHSNTSLSATYDFAGLQVIGAGDIVLKSGLPLSEVTFNSCDEIEADGAYFDLCSFYNTTGSGALKVDSPTEMERVTNCHFEGNAYGIRLMSATAQEYTFDGITFYNNTKDVYIAATSGTVTINVINGGDTPTYTSAGATVVINNTVTVKVTVKDINTGSPIENARVLLEAAAGGDLPEGTDILTGLTNSSGIVQTTSFNYTNPQPVKGVVRRATAAYGTLYKSSPIAGTITAAGFDATILLIPD